MANDLVVLLHGIMRSKTDMVPLTRFLKKSGYDTLNILYPARKKSLEDLTEFVHEKIITSPDYTPDKTLHFVTHSLGGLLARYYIATRKPQNLGKVVMLGTPNTGSELADVLGTHKLSAKLFHRFYGPAGAQLATTYTHPETDINYPIGVIAGTLSINPLAAFILPKPHDGMVSVERTKINGMKDHIMLPTTHAFMMFNPKVMKQVEYFLKNEKFRI